MPTSFFEIRVCESCGLRYPLPTTGNHPVKRCPACMGKTRIVLSQNLTTESKPSHPGSSPRKNGHSILLDNVRSAWNVGSILRTADGFGFSHAYLCGITPSADNDAVKKTSLGAESSVSWTSHPNAVRLATEIKSKGVNLTALEEHEHSAPLLELDGTVAKRQTVLIVGNEITGVDPHLLTLCDEIYHIPMYGEKKSFNVAIAFAIAAYAFGTP